MKTIEQCLHKEFFDRLNILLVTFFLSKILEES